MGESGQRHDPAALYPRVKEPPLPIVQEAGWAPEPVWTQEARGKILCLCWGWNLDCPVVQPVARHYTDWATLVPFCLTNSLQLGIHAKTDNLSMPVSSALRIVPHGEELSIPAPPSNLRIWREWVLQKVKKMEYKLQVSTVLNLKINACILSSKPNSVT
jgi:hypothetical protein